MEPLGTRENPSASMKMETLVLPQEVALVVYRYLQLERYGETADKFKGECPLLSQPAIFNQASSVRSLADILSDYLRLKEAGPFAPPPLLSLCLALYAHPFLSLSLSLSHMPTLTALVCS